MKIKKQGDYKMKNWSLEVECTGGNGWLNPKRPCHSTLELYDGDIVKRKYFNRSSSGTDYGFICSVCRCFTALDSTLIPDEIKEYCPQVAAKTSDTYEKLTDEEKKLSEPLL